MTKVMPSVQVRRAVAAVFIIRATLYGWQSFNVFHSLFGSFAEQVFLIFFFAFLALFFLFVTALLFLRPEQSASLLSVAISVIALEPILFFTMDWSYITATATWLVGVVLFSVFLTSVLQTT